MKKEKSKKRLDLLLVEKNLIATRSRAKAEIMAGNVLVNGIKRDKPGEAVSSGAKIEILATQNPYVSRGGLKLEKALHEFGLNLENKIVLDIGASTGGFTHCVLKHGAQKVYALDVGYGQLDWKLRHEPRIVNLERFNVRHLKREDLQELPHLATIDVSFISLRLVLPVVASLFIPEIVCLVKPQFEAKPAQVGKKGVVKNAAVHRAGREKRCSQERCCPPRSSRKHRCNVPAAVLSGGRAYFFTFKRPPRQYRILSLPLC